MNKFILLLLLLFPISLSAVARADKCWVLEQSKDHKEKSKVILDRLRANSTWISNLSDRRHLETIVESAAKAVFVPGARAKILAVGIDLIGSISGISLDMYWQMRNDILYATYHLENAYFYSNLSLVYGCTCKNNFSSVSSRNEKVGRAFLQAIESLTLCDMLTSCIKDNDNRFAVSDYVCDARDLIYKEFNGDAPGKYRISEDVFGCYENLQEVLAEKGIDNKLWCALDLHFRATVAYLRHAENCYREL